MRTVFTILLLLGVLRGLTQDGFFYSRTGEPVPVEEQQSNQYEQYILKEYLAYQLYQMFTPKSFDTRLIRMTYVDTGRKNKEYEAYAFLIEEVGRLEQQLGAKAIKKKNVHQDATAYNYVNIFCIFQFMIGNHDWSIPSLHNTKLLSRKEEGLPIL